MKAAVLYKKHDLKIENLPIPIPNENEVLIKTSYCGVCGTDVHLYNGDEGSVKMTPLTIPGHEISGILVKTHEKVVVDPNYYCNTCFECINNRPHYCENMKNTGVNIDGGFAQYLIADKSQVHIIPQNVSLEEASFAEPISCCLHGLDKININSSDNVLIIGGGTIGLLMLQLCKYFKVKSVGVVEIVENKRKTAALLGAEKVYNNVHDIKGESYNKVIECVGLKQTCIEAIKVCANTGHVLFFGLTKPKEKIFINPFDLFKRDITITSSYINPYTIKKALAILETKAINIAPLIGNIYKLDKLKDVLENSDLRKNGKILIKLG